MKYRIIIISVLLINLHSCKERISNENSSFNYKAEKLKTSYNIDSFVFYENSKYVDDENNYNERGIDMYYCYYDSINGLNVKMVWGFMNGETFHLSIKDDTLKTNLSSWGCTNHERFQYQTLEQTLRLHTYDFENSDTLIGYINYKGIQDVDRKIKEWSSSNKNAEWLKHLKPEIATIRGYFKLKLFDDISDKYVRDYDSGNFNKNR